MRGKVVHLPDEIHGLLKVHCERVGVSMAEFVTALIKDELKKPESRGVIAVARKKLLAIREKEEEVPAYLLPPFWAMRQKPGETKDEQLERAESCAVALDEGSEEGRGGGQEDRLDSAEDRSGDCGAARHRSEGERSFVEELEERLETCSWPPDLDGGAEAGSGRAHEEDLGEEAPCEEEGGEEPRRRVV